jgi:hypothetical protein
MHLEFKKEKSANPTKQVYFIGTSAVLTIAQSHVKRLGIDDLTFFEEKPVDNGILLEMRKLYCPAKEEIKAEEE